MHLNKYADGLAPLDMTQFDEFRSLLRSAADLGIPHTPTVRYFSHNTVIRHMRLHYLEWGDPLAPPVLLLHGGNQSAHSWDLVSLHLADRYHVYALDQRGHGDSEWARDSDYSPRAMARDVEELIAQQALRAPLIFGHSMGGRVAMTLTAENPALPRALVLVDVGPEIAAKGAERIRDFVDANVEFDSLDEFIDRVAAYDPFRSREHMERTARYNLIRRADGKYVSKTDRILRAATTSSPADAATLDTVRRFTCSVLVVRGEQSNILEPEAAQRFVDALPHGRLVTVPRCGHNVHTQNTPVFLEAVRPFLDSL